MSLRDKWTAGEIEGKAASLWRFRRTASAIKSVVRLCRRWRVEAPPIKRLMAGNSLPALGGSPVLDGIGGRRLEDSQLDESETSEGRLSTRRQIFSEPHDVPASPFFIVEIITSLPKATYNFGIASPPTWLSLTLTFSAGFHLAV